MLVGCRFFMNFDRLSRAVWCARFAVASATLALVPTMALAQQAEPQTAAPPAKFMINAMDVSGATLLPQETIENVVAPFLGPDRTSDDVESARKALQAAFAAKGYESVQVDIPPQPNETFSQGIVQLKVTEVSVGAVAVTGSKFHSGSLVRDQLASLQPGRPLNLKTLQAELTSANRYPDREISPSFVPGKKPGTIDVELKVKDSLPVHGSLELNNDHSPSTTSLRAIGSIRWTDALRVGNTLSASYIVAPENRKETEVISASYNAPILGSPWSVLLYGYKSNSNIAALGGSNVLGNGYQIGVRANYQLSAGTSFQSLSAGADFKHFNQDIFVAGERAGSAPIEYVPLVLGYSFSKATERASIDLSLGATAGLRIFRRTGCFDVSADQSGTVPCRIVDQFTNKDLDASENFFHLNLDASYVRSWRKDFVAALRISAQIADAHLVTNEQFAAGGMTSVRGYLQSEAVGDDGVVGSLELRLPSIAQHLPSIVNEFRLFAFIDAGKVHILRTLPDQAADFDLVGVGGGARLSLLDHLNGELSVGLPMTDGPNSKKHGVRTMFTAKGQF